MPPENNSIHEDFSDEENKFFDEGDAGESAGEAATDGGVHDEHPEHSDEGASTAGAGQEDAAAAAVAGEGEGEEEQGKESGEKAVTDAEKAANREKAMHEERNKRRALERQVAEMRNSLQALSGLKAELEALRKAPEPKAEDEFETDPVGTLKRELDGLKAKEAEGERARAQMTEQQRQLADLQTRTRAATAEFQEENPDYPDALNHLMESRVKELRVFGMDDAQIANALSSEAIAIARFAEQNERNPAEVVYEMARLRGYAKAATKPAPATTASPTAESLQEKLDKIDKGQRDAQTLANAGGGKKDKNLSLADIEKMSDEEFDKVWAEMQADAYGS